MPATQKRRSIRDGFRSRTVPDETIAAVLEAGLEAPSSKDAQPWRLHVVSNQETLNKLADAVFRAKNPDAYVPINPATGLRRRWGSTVVESAEVLRSVTLGIFVENRGEFSGGRATVAAATGEVLRSAMVGYGLEMIGIGAAIQAMWGAAVECGLSGVFMGDIVIAESEINEVLGVSGDLIGVLALGFSDAEAHPKTLLPDRVVRHD